MVTTKKYYVRIALSILASRQCEKGKIKHNEIKAAAPEVLLAQRVKKGEARTKGQTELLLVLRNAEPEGTKGGMMCWNALPWCKDYSELKPIMKNQTPEKLPFPSYLFVCGIHICKCAHLPSLSGKTS